MKKSKKLKFMVILGTIVTSVSAAIIPINVITKSQNVQNDIKNNVGNSDIKTIETDNTNDVKQSKLVPFDFNESWPLLVQNTGPIVSFKNQISSLDWFSSTRWTLDILNATFKNEKIFGESPKFVEYTDRAFINWALDRNNNVLWLLTNGIISDKQTSKKAGNNNNEADKIVPEKQKLIKINSLNGEILDVVDVAYSPKNMNFLYYSISVLDSGNIMIYGQGNDNWKQFDIYNEQTKQFLTKNSESTDLDTKIKEDLNSNSDKKGDVRTRFIFSIAPNMNILVMTNFGWNENDTNYQKDKYSDIYFAFVDDNMNRIVNQKDTDWYYAKKMIERTDMGELNSESDTFPKLVYKLPDGRVLFSIYHKLYVFYPQETIKQRKPIFNEFDYQVKDEKTKKYKPVESWTTDTDNNVYAKFSDDGRIQKISISGSTQQDTKISISTYYNIEGNKDTAISENAKNFVLYNVYGYSGQIMMLNPRKITNKRTIEEYKEDDLKNKNIGIAIAITKNATGNDGDSKGYLNTEKAFVKSSDFNIEEDVLKNKLPSEISRNDLKITYDGFFTQNPEKDDKGNLKYPQFVKVVMDDNNSKKEKEGNLKITANIDQIPWFVSNNIMPNDIPPLTITKWFNTGNNISQRVTWKDSALDYDFKNTLPTKVTLEDVKRFDPFSINLASQRTTISGINYPTKEYKIENKNDSDGTITIKATIKYLPIDVEAKAENLLTQEFSKQYNIFKTNDEKKFDFIGNQNNESQEDIKTIPQLKELSESNLLPSSFNANDTSSILKFINTDSSKGYPLSKMNFTVKPNDVSGTLTISGKLQDGYYNDSSANKEFKKTYTGLNKVNDYDFNFNNSPSGFNKTEYLPSEIDEQIIYKSFATYKGFNSSDLKLALIPNDEIGQLLVKFYLDNNYPESVANSVGFTRSDNSYSREFVVNGFKTTTEYEEQYSIKFKDDNSKDFDQIKRYTPNQIKQILTKKEKEENQLYIGKTKINSEEDFAKNVIEKYGSKIPKDLTSSNFEQKIYYNDPNGEITVKLVFKNIEGLTNELVFIQRFTGFAKGNQVPTDDILSFKTETKLFLDNPDFKNMLPSTIKESLDDNNKRKEMLDKFLSFYSGDYKKLIDENNFTLNVVADNIHGYITIKITFDGEKISNKESLLTYAATFNGFKTE